MADNHIYRSKPVTIQAFQMTPERIQSNVDWPEWLHSAWNAPQDKPGSLFIHYTEPRTYAVYTLEGIMVVNPGDYIIKGLEGEIYPCKPSVFEAKYERV